MQGGDHARLGREVEDRARGDLVHHGLERSEVHDVQLAQLGLAGHARGVSRGQIVDDDHGVAVGEQRVDDM